MDQQINFWNDIKKFLENIADEKAKIYENPIVMQHEENVTSMEITAKITLGEIIFGQPAVMSKALPLQNPFNKSVLLGAQVKFLFLVNHPGINLMLEEMNKIQSSRTFEDTLQNLSKQIYVIDEDIYEHILKFSLAIIQKMVHKQNNVGSTNFCNQKGVCTHLNESGTIEEIRKEELNSSRGTDCRLVREGNKNSKGNLLSLSSYRKCRICMISFCTESALLNHYRKKHKINLNGLAIKNARVPMLKLDQQFKIAIENQQKVEIIPFKCKICQYIGNSLLESQKENSIHQMISLAVSNRNPPH